MPLQGQRGNVVLDALSAEDRTALAPHLDERTVARGDGLLHQGDEVRLVHFPLSADLSNSLRFSDGWMIEATSVGRDGVTGLAAFLAEAPIAWDVICQIPGAVMAIEADILGRRVEVSPLRADGRLQQPARGDAAVRPLAPGRLRSKRKNRSGADSGAGRRPARRPNARPSTSPPRRFGA